MPFRTRPTLQGTFGMVSSTHWLASQSAMAVLESGGNAYDPAVGGAVGLHGGRAAAPAAATTGHNRGLGLDLVPGTGPLAAAVPGAFDAWMLLLRDHGTKPLEEILKSATGNA